MLFYGFLGIGALRKTSLKALGSLAHATDISTQYIDKLIIIKSQKKFFFQINDMISLSNYYKGKGGLLCKLMKNKLFLKFLCPRLFYHQNLSEK